MLDREHPTFVRFGRAARARFRMVTAFRLGYVAGESLEPQPCPYSDERGQRLFEAGLQAGRESAIRHGASTP